jgi:mRNA interferase MazF
VPFPFVERPRLRPRPALLITVEDLMGEEPLGWTLMITSASNAGWRDDVSLVQRYRECGLPVPCVVRTAKIATIALADAAPLGRLPDDLMTAVRAKLSRFLDL